MSGRPGPRGCRLYVDPADDVPLVWLEVEARGGSAADPLGKEGFFNHVAQLAHHGAGDLDREHLDAALDRLGASVDVAADRDSLSISAVCLARNLDRLVELLAQILAHPRMEASEHDKLLREARHSLDDLRDDDGSLATRFFNRDYLPGHPYARTALGTEDSLGRLDLDELRAAYRRYVVPENLVIGIAGAVDEVRAEQVAARLVEALPDSPAPALPSVEVAQVPRGRRILLVDKPERTQSQILIGHVGLRYGCDEAAAFSLVETVFGGTFTSRLMQEIRVKRGWSYGAGCRMGRARGPYYFRISLAPSAETTAEAVALTMGLFEQVARAGITADELDFARRYLAGSLPFHLATARQRMRLAVKNHLFGQDDDYIHAMPARLERVTLADTTEVARRCLHPDDALIVVVATADEVASALEPLAPTTVVAYDSY